MAPGEAMQACCAPDAGLVRAESRLDQSQAARLVESTSNCVRDGDQADEAAAQLEAVPQAGTLDA